MDDCEEEIVSEKEFQVWRHTSGKFIAFIWLQLEGKQSQCLLLNGVQFHSQKRLKDLFSYIIPALQRAWEICCMVSDAKEEVYKDSLTNLFNQKFLDEILKRKLKNTEGIKLNFPFFF